MDYDVAMAKMSLAGYCNAKNAEESYLLLNE